MDYQVKTAVTHIENSVLNQYCITGRNEVNIKKTTVSSQNPIRTMETLPPRWRAMNVEVFKVTDGTLASQGGLFADDDGNVKAVWASFSLDDDRHEPSSVLGGLSSRLILPILNKIKSGEKPIVRGIDAEFWPLQLCNARIIGVPDKWIDKIKQKSEDEDHLATAIYVLGITDICSSSGKLLKPGDIILAINDTIISSIADFSYFNNHEVLEMVSIFFLNHCVC